MVFRGVLSELSSRNGTQGIVRMEFKPALPASVYAPIFAPAWTSLSVESCSHRLGQSVESCSHRLGQALKHVYTGLVKALNHVHTGLVKR